MRAPPASALASGVASAGRGIRRAWGRSSPGAESGGQAPRTAQVDVDRVLRPSVVRDGRVVSTPRVPVAARRELAHHGAEIRSVKVWSADGTLVWTQFDPRRIGQRYPVSEE